MDGGRDINLTVNLDGEVVYKSVVKRDKQRAAAKGRKTALAGG